MEKRYIYILQMHTESMPAKFVKLMTRYSYSHVGISLDKSCDVIYSFGRKSLHNVLNGGFVAEKRTGVFLRKFNRTVCRIYELEVSREQYERVRSLMAQVDAEREKYKYDFLGAFLRFFHIRIAFKDHYVCSQFVAEILEKAEICKFKKSCCFVKPQDFDALENKREIYTGRYCFYRSRA